MPSIRCPLCGKETLYASDAPLFCSHCAGKLSADAKNGLDERIGRALREEDICKRHAALLLLREEFPENRQLEMEILCIGRLYERGGKPDFFRIPFWPLAAFEKPGEFSKKMRAEMLVRFFENPDIANAMALYESAEDFWAEYLFRMAKEYVRLFLKGSSEKNTVLGFRRRENDVLKRCSQALGHMLENIESAPYPDEGKRKLLALGLRRAFQEEFGADGPAEPLKEWPKFLAKFLREKRK